MPSFRTIARQSLLTIGALVAAKVAADQFGGVTRQVLNGELTWWQRITGGI